MLLPPLLLPPSSPLLDGAATSSVWVVLFFGLPAWRRATQTPKKEGEGRPTSKTKKEGQSQHQAGTPAQTQTRTLNLLCDKLILRPVEKWNFHDLLTHALTDLPMESQTHEQPPLNSPLSPKKSQQAHLCLGDQISSTTSKS